MPLRLGALYRHRSAEEVARSWEDRLRGLREARLTLDVAGLADGRVRVEIRPRRRRQVPHRVLGALVREALGPEREEEAELWLLEPGDAGHGALRLEGDAWDDCLTAIAAPEAHQVRLWSPLVCPASIHRELAHRGGVLGLELRSAESWAVLAVPRRKAKPEFPPPWRGNYGW